jgi:nicotinamide mononucleotide adenylyltransferase
LATALYLAHLNPVTNAHIEIIRELKEKSDTVKVMPVVFRLGDREINSKSFPFNFETRKRMLESVFKDSITITDDYAFFAPFKRYFPPLLAPKSWELRKQVLKGVEGDFFSYTGDKAEGLMLKIYRLKPQVGERKALSAASVKEKMYEAALGKDTDWKTYVTESIAEVIEEEWETVSKFAKSEDRTTRVAGMKFPKEGWSSK